MGYGLREYGRFQATKAAAQRIEVFFKSPWAQAHSYEITQGFLWFSYVTVFLNIFVTLPFEIWIINLDYERWQRYISIFNGKQVVSVWEYIGFDVAQIIILIVCTIPIIISAFGIRKILKLDKEISSITDLRKTDANDENFVLAETPLEDYPWYFRAAWKFVPWAIFLTLYSWLWIFMMHPWTGIYVAPLK